MSTISLVSEANQTGLQPNNAVLTTIHYFRNRPAQCSLINQISSAVVNVWQIKKSATKLIVVQRSRV